MPSVCGPAPIGLGGSILYSRPLKMRGITMAKLVMTDKKPTNYIILLVLLVVVVYLLFFR